MPKKMKILYALIIAALIALQVLIVNSRIDGWLYRRLYPTPTPTMHAPIEFRAI